MLPADSLRSPRPGRRPPARLRAVRRSGCALRAALLLGWTLAFAVPAAVSAQSGDGFLDEAAVRETLVGHTLRGKDWTEYYTADGEIRGRGRHLGIRDYGGRWTVAAGKVCYHYGHASFDTCSWLRRDGDRVTHHRQDGALKKDGVAVRQPGDRLGEFR